MITCLACGSQNDSSVRFCSHCGAANPQFIPPPPAQPNDPNSAFLAGGPDGAALPLTNESDLTWPSQGSYQPSMPPPPPSTSTPRDVPLPPPNWSTSQAYPSLEYSMTQPPYAAQGQWESSAPNSVRFASDRPVTPFGAALASWGQRVGSMLIDGVILSVVSIGIVVAAIFVFGHTVHTISTIQGSNNATVMTTTRQLSSSAALALFGFTFIISLLYFAIGNGTGHGRTLGNLAVGIAVSDASTGTRIGFSRGLLRAFTRSVLYMCFIIPGVINDLMPLWNNRRQTIADQVARSVMVRY